MQRIQFIYKNHRGEVQDRDVLPLSLDYVTVPNSTYGYSPGWFLTCKDFSFGRDGTDIRSFALCNIQLPGLPFANPSLNNPYRLKLE